MKWGLTGLPDHLRCGCTIRGEHSAGLLIIVWSGCVTCLILSICIKNMAMAYPIPIFMGLEIICRSRKLLVYFSSFMMHENIGKQSKAKQSAMGMGCFLTLDIFYNFIIQPLQYGCKMLFSSLYDFLVLIFLAHLFYIFLISLLLVVLYNAEKGFRFILSAAF